MPSYVSAPIKVAEGGDETTLAVGLVAACAGWGGDRPVAHVLDCRPDPPREDPAPSYLLLDRCGLPRCKPLMLSGLGGLEWVAGLEMLCRTSLLDEGDAVIVQLPAIPAAAIWAFRVSARPQDFAALVVSEARVDAPSTQQVASGVTEVEAWRVDEALRVPGEGLGRSVAMVGGHGGRAILRVTNLEGGPL